MIYMIYLAKGKHLICPVDGARQVGQLFGVSSFSALDSQTMCPIELSPSDLVACNRSCTPKHAFLFPWKDPLATFGTSPSPSEVHLDAFDFPCSTVLLHGGLPC